MTQMRRIPTPGSMIWVCRCWESAMACSYLCPDFAINIVEVKPEGTEKQEKAGVENA